VAVHYHTIISLSSKLIALNINNLLSNLPVVRLLVFILNKSELAKIRATDQCLGQYYILNGWFIYWQAAIFFIVFTHLGK